MYRIWTDDEVDFLIYNHAGMSYDELADHLNRTVDSVKKKSNRLGLKKKNHNSGWPRQTAYEPSRREIAWVAGLLEGEGCFDEYNKGGRIRLEMTDRDVVVKAKKILGGAGGIREVPPEKDCHSTTYAITISAEGDLRYILPKILPYMGGRRSNIIRDIICGLL